MTMPHRHALALTLAAALLAAAPLTAQAAEHLVTVTGHGTVAVAPDTAMIRIGVTSQGKTARDASAANAQQMTKVSTPSSRAASPRRTSRPRGCRCSRNTTPRTAPTGCSASR